MLLHSINPNTSIEETAARAKAAHAMTEAGKALGRFGIKPVPFDPWSVPGSDHDAANVNYVCREAALMSPVWLNAGSIPGSALPSDAFRLQVLTPDQFMVRPAIRSIKSCHYPSGANTYYPFGNAFYLQHPWCGCLTAARTDTQAEYVSGYGTPEDFGNRTELLEGLPQPLWSANFWIGTCYLDPDGPAYPALYLSNPYGDGSEYAAALPRLARLAAANGFKLLAYSPSDHRGQGSGYFVSVGTAKLNYAPDTAGRDRFDYYEDVTGYDLIKTVDGVPYHMAYKANAAIIDPARSTQQEALKRFTVGSVPAPQLETGTLRTRCAQHSYIVYPGSGGSNMVCCCCEESYNEDDVYAVNGEVYCPECYNDHYCECYVTNEHIPQDDAAHAYLMIRGTVSRYEEWVNQDLVSYCELTDQYYVTDAGQYAHYYNVPFVTADDTGTFAAEHNVQDAGWINDSGKWYEETVSVKLYGLPIVIPSEFHTPDQYILPHMYNDLDFYTLEALREEYAERYPVMSEFITLEHYCETYEMLTRRLTPGSIYIHHPETLAALYDNAAKLYERPGLCENMLPLIPSGV